MAHLTTAALTAVCESICLRGSWAVASRLTGVAESTLYLWLHKSKAAEKINDTASPLHFTWRDAQGYFHEHVVRAKSECVMASVYLAMDQNRNGIEEVMYDPATGRPILALNPAYLNWSDDELLEELLDPRVDRYLWNYDPLTDERTTPIYQTRVTQIPASLRQKILSGLAPTVFGDRTEINHRVQGSVVHTIQPAPFVSRHAVIDGEFKALPSSVEQLGDGRLDIAELRARAAVLMREGPKNPLPDAPVKDAMGNVVGKPPIADKPDDAPLPLPTVKLSDLQRAHTNTNIVPKTDKRPAANYHRRNDPTAPGARAMKIIV